MDQHKIQFPYQARYFQHGELNETTEQVIFAIHGYGQQAKYFVRKFKQLAERSKISIIAPEGLNRFYLEGFSGRVGATWMTREDRETDITNYINYLNTIYKRIVHQIPTHAKVSILGFSQGSATASRWIMNGAVQFSHFILWAGIFPPDLGMPESINRLKDKSITYVYGTKDPFITKERLSEMKQISQSLRVNPKILTFDGEHTLDEKLLERLFIDES